jgi:hypothetical protein
MKVEPANGMMRRMRRMGRYQNKGQRVHRYVIVQRLIGRGSFDKRSVDLRERSPVCKSIRRIGEFHGLVRCRTFEGADGGIHFCVSDSSDERKPS